MKKVKLWGRVFKLLFIVIFKAADCAIHYLLIKIGVREKREGRNECHE